MTSLAFDPTETFDPGVLAIEASAGTGKTYALATIAVRVLAETDVRASQLLVVTFTRSAARELGDRIRRRVAEAVAYLAEPDPEPTGNDVLEHLRAAGPTELARRLDRLTTALSEFDTMPISTIHSFAEQVLKALGASSGVDPDAALAGIDREVVRAACVDVLAGASVDPARVPYLPTLDALHGAVRTAMGSTQLQVVPGDDQRDAFPNAVALAELVGEVIECATKRRRAAGAMSFDDLLVDLDAALSDPRRTAVVDSVRARIRCALIDEFQDTDPVQWSIISRLFADPATGHRLVLVGDPKQAIYSFRGADVATYLAAISSSGTRRRSLRINRRSDASVLAGVEALCAGVTFGDPGVAFVPVEAAPGHQESRLRDASGAPLPGVVLRAGVRFSKPDLTGSGAVSADAARPAIGADLVGCLRELFEHARIIEADEARPVVPADVAVLAKTNADTQRFQRLLADAGIPAVVTRGSSVLRSDAAGQWRILLDALARPTDPRRARSVAASWFGGRDASWLAAADDPAIEAVQLQLQHWLDTLHHHGVAELVRSVVRESAVVPRLLARPGGRRDVTDLDHVAELLQTAASHRSMGVAGLLAAIDPSIADSDAGQPDDPAARRIETDEAAVQIMTVHVAKGLEFPIVCVPDLWSARSNNETPKVFTDSDGVRYFDVARSAQWPDTAASAERTAKAETQALGERLRLAYVALTRASHQCILWWLPGHNGSTSPLSRLLFDRLEDGSIDPDRIDTHRAAKTVSVTAAAAGIPGLRAALGPAVEVVEFGPAVAASAAAVDVAPIDVDLDVASLARRPDRSSMRWSFTAVTNRAATVVGDPFDDSLADRGAADEQLASPSSDPDAEASLDPRSDATAPTAADDDPMLLDRLPSSAGFGTLVHSVLEAADFAAPALDAELDDALHAAMRRRSIDLVPVRGSERGADLVRSGLANVLHTPLGGPLGALRLADVIRRDRRDELAFELPLATGGPAIDERRIGRILVEELHRDDPFRSWAERLGAGVFDARLAGHLTGSIDLVMRAPVDGKARYFVVDYKTNRLSPRNRVGRPEDYTPQRVAAAMAEHHYPLQALLYNVALHRWLRSRLHGYDPQEHLGGAVYLFVRAMVGPATPSFEGVAAGVCTWPIPPSAVVRVSDALDGRPSGGAR